MTLSTALSFSCARIVAQYIVDQELGGYRTNLARTEPDWVVVVGTNPDTPDSMIAVTDGPVFKDDGRLMGTGAHIVHPGVQVRTRAIDRDVAYQKLTDIKVVLEAAKRVEVVIDEKTFRLDNVSLNSHVMFIGNDPGTDRPTFVLNTYITAKEIV